MNCYDPDNAAAAMKQAYEDGFEAARQKALEWCIEMSRADWNKDWQEACEACREAIESAVKP